MMGLESMDWPEAVLLIFLAFFITGIIRGFITEYFKYKAIKLQGPRSLKCRELSEEESKELMDALRNLGKAQGPVKLESNMDKKGNVKTDFEPDFDPKTGEFYKKD